MPININEFVKGVNTDTDVLRLDNQTLRGAQNMRQLDVDGKGWVQTNLLGNEEKFRLNQGFIPLGSAEYNGVIYIASYCPPTGQGALGCYPAPKALADEDCSQSGWDSSNKKYADLFNFTGPLNPRQPGSNSVQFITELFNFGDGDDAEQIDMIIREDFDGSVNMYLAQKDNPVRVYNSGFNQDGECTKANRRYWNGSFPNEVNLLNESEQHLDIEFQGTGDAGRLRGGGWIFYFRYANENYDTTSFFAETNNIIILPGSTIIDGIGRTGTSSDVETTKSVNLLIKNVDPTYAYLEIGYQFNGDDAVEYGIITERIALDPNLTQYSVSITGNEESYAVDASDILKRKPSWDGARSHCQLENVYFPADLFDTTNLDDERIRELADFCQLITLYFDDTKQIQHRDTTVPFTDTTTQPYFLPIYSDETNVYSYTGYFRGEAYPFGVVFVLNNGREIGAFPTLGRDDWDLGAPVNNDEGIYRFPTIESSPTVSGNYVNIMGVKFNMTAALAGMTQWMRDNISGFYFTRGERQRNLLYQGQTSNIFNGQGINPGDQQFFLLQDTPSTCLRNENFFPGFDNGESYYFVNVDVSLVNNEYSFAAQFSGYNQYVPNRSAFWSIDHFFRKSVPINKAYLISFGRFSRTPINNASVGRPQTDVQSNWFYQRDDVYSWSTDIRGYREVLNVAPWESTNNNRFVSYWKEGTKSEYKSLLYFYASNVLGTYYYEIKNEETAFNGYIPIIAGNNYNQNLLNLYLSNPDPNVYDISKIYDVKSVTYRKISKFYRLHDVEATPSLVNEDIQYRGDCFLQRSFLKYLFNPIYAPGLKDDGITDGGPLNPGFFSYVFEKTFAFGKVISQITENTVNAECRLEDLNDKFYPGSQVSIYDFAVKNIDRESEKLNEGYNNQLSAQGWRGINLEIPFFVDKKPSAIAFSSKHVLGAYQDGYRLIDIASVREYDYRLGRIVQVLDHNGTLISIQEFGINRHLVNERALLDQGASSGELLIGSGQLLDTKAINLTDFMGSQHQWSMVKTDFSLYGFDFNKRKIWRLNSQMQVEPISDMQGYRAETYRLCEFNTSDSDISEGIPDNPVIKGGIAGYYDRKYNEIYFAVIKATGEEDDDGMICYNEAGGYFSGKRTYISPYGFSINEDFFTFNPSLFKSTNPTSQTFLGDCWIHGIANIGGVDNYTCFYGKTEADISYIEFVVNNPADIAKVFDKLDISSAPNDLYRVTFETQNQKIDHFPFVEGTATSFWRDPEYKENLWRMPITRTQTIQGTVNNIYEVGSRLRGRWVKIRLEYKTKNSIFIKSVLTSFRQSNY